MSDATPWRSVDNHEFEREHDLPAEDTTP